MQNDLPGIPTHSLLHQQCSNLGYILSAVFSSPPGLLWEYFPLDTAQQGAKFKQTTFTAPR